MIQLEAEGFVLDRVAEVERMARLSEPEQAARAQEIRTCYRKAPVGGDLVRSARVPEGGGKQAMDRGQMQTALKYQRAHKCSWDEAVEKTTGAAAQ